MSLGHDDDRAHGPPIGHVPERVGRLFHRMRGLRVGPQAPVAPPADHFLDIGPVSRRLPADEGSPDESRPMASLAPHCSSGGPQSVGLPAIGSSGLSGMSPSGRRPAAPSVRDPGANGPRFGETRRAAKNAKALVKSTIFDEVPGG